MHPYNKSYLRLLIPIVLTFFGLQIYKLVVNSLSDTIIIFTAALISAIIFLTTLYLFGLPSFEKNIIKQFARNIKNKIVA